MNTSGEAVRGLVKSPVEFGISLAASPLANFLAGFAMEGGHGGNMAALPLARAHESGQLRRLF